MKRIQSLRFLSGLIGGWLLVAIAAWLLARYAPGTDVALLRTEVASLLQRSWHFVDLNLQGSVLPFTFVLSVYCVQLRRLRRWLAAPEPQVGQVVRAEQHLDLCSSLFFGIGVIWTAIGMRDALLYALGDRDMSVAHSAFAVLQRLVDGGILLALSTTIVGGIGGYLMRAVKSVCLGRELNDLYMVESSRPEREHLATLQRIERQLSSGSSE